MGIIGMGDLLRHRQRHRVRFRLAIWL